MILEEGGEEKVGHDEILGHEEGEEDDARGIKEEKYFEVKRRGAKDDERGLRKLIDPRLPTESERKEHEMTHIPYRN